MGTSPSSYIQVPPPGLFSTNFPIYARIEILISAKTEVFLSNFSADKFFKSIHNIMQYLISIVSV